MKKSLSKFALTAGVLLSLSMIFSACGDPSAENPSEPEPAPAEETEVVTYNVTDKTSFDAFTKDVEDNIENDGMTKLMNGGADTTAAQTLMSNSTAAIPEDFMSAVNGLVGIFNGSNSETSSSYALKALNFTLVDGVTANVDTLNWDISADMSTFEFEGSGAVKGDASVNVANLLTAFGITDSSMFTQVDADVDVSFKGSVSVADNSVDEPEEDPSVDDEGIEAQYDDGDEDAAGVFEEEASEETTDESEEETTETTTETTTVTVDMSSPSYKVVIDSAKAAFNYEVAFATKSNYVGKLVLNFAAELKDGTYSTDEFMTMFSSGETPDFTEFDDYFKSFSLNVAFCDNDNNETYSLLKTSKVSDVIEFAIENGLFAGSSTITDPTVSE